MNHIAKAIALCLLTYALCAGESGHQQEVGRRFYLKHNLIFISGPPRVYPDWISFPRESSACDESLWITPLGRSEEVEIAGITRSGRFDLVTIAVGDKRHEILLDHSSRSKRRKSFDLIFSTAPVIDEIKNCEMKTERDLIHCLGYPIYRCTQKGKQIFLYNLGFVGHRILGYHDVWFELSGAKITRCYGQI